MRAEAGRGWVLRFALGVMFVTTVPYLVGYFTQGEEWRFTGFVFGVEDGNSYIAKMLTGANGAWLFRTPYTAIPQSGVLAFLPYLLLGKLTSPPAQHEQLVALFHLFRIIGGCLSILATYDFISLFIRQEIFRRWGVVLATLGGGLGWLAVLLGNRWPGTLPLEFYSPESFGFLELYGLPHLAMARAFLLWGLRGYLIAKEQRHGWGDRIALPTTFGIRQWVSWAGVQVGGIWLLMGLMQPLTVLIAWVVVGAHLGIWGLVLWVRQRQGGEIQWANWREYLKCALWAVVISAGIVVYTGWAFARDAYLRQWAAQNLILSPPFLDYLLAYGLVIPVAVLGGYRLLREESPQCWLPFAWVLLLPILAYIPHNLQRRFVEGGYVALVVLVVLALERVRFRWMVWFTVPLLLSTVMLLSGGLQVVLHPDEPAYRPAAEVAAFDALRGHVSGGEVVLSAYETGNALPAWVPVRVMVGHGPESARLAQMLADIEAFFDSSRVDGERVAILRNNRVDVVFWGPEERSLGSWDPRTASFLEMVYDRERYYLFTVEIRSEVRYPR